MTYQQECNHASNGVGKTKKTAAEALSVSAAMALAKGALEGVVVRVLGEVSEVSIKSGYKAAYFTVKDKQSSLSCMMWNSRYEVCGVRLAVGQLIELQGRFTLYAAKGRMNFEVFSFSLAGEGMLRQQVADLARKLDAEGLMSPARKRSLPSLPQKVGLVTSPRGDAVHDVLRTLRRRFPLAEVLVAGVPVEGRDAALGIIEGIEAVCNAGAEVLLVVRGGGSFEDLMPFNDERLARAIAACPIPVVTGIGHEPDTSIADMVADLRASTPTAAAESVTPSWENLGSIFSGHKKSLTTHISHRLEREAARLSRCADRPVFRDAVYLFAAEAQTLDLASERLTRVLPANLERDRARLTSTSERLTRAIPLTVARERSNLAVLQNRMIVRGDAIIPRFEAQVRLSAARMHDLSPLAILGRGYAIARIEEGSIVKSVENAPLGSRIEVTVADGQLSCEVKDIHHIETTVELWEE